MTLLQTINEPVHITRNGVVAIAVGPTPGHVYPALAVGNAFDRSGLDLEVLIVDTPEGLSTKLLESTRWRRATLASLPIAGAGTTAKVAAAASFLAGVRQARRLLRESGARLVISFGAHVSASLVIAARTARIPTAIHEMNAEPGLANRVLAPFANRVYLGHRGAAGAWAGRRSMLVGNPVRAPIAALASETRSPPDPDRPARVLVTSSNIRGGRFFARTVPGLLTQVAAAGVKLEILHQTGDAPLAPVVHAYRAAAIRARVVTHLDDMSDAYRWADFAITQGGAGTLAELALAGVPALVVPLGDAAWDHQAANARAWANAGAGFWAREPELATRPVASKISALLLDPLAWQTASSRARALMPSDAADRIVADCAKWIA